eukprot:jgi/Mesvir1/14047/Mv11904-RA.1
MAARLAVAATYVAPICSQPKSTSSNGSLVAKASASPKLASFSGASLRIGRKHAGFNALRKITHYAVVASGESSGVAAAEAPTQIPPKKRVEQLPDVRIVPVDKNTVTIRGLTKTRLKPEIQYSLNRGTTENAYVINAPKGVVLVDLPDIAFSDAFLKALDGSVGLGKVKYLVLQHVSPRRLDALKAFLEARPRNASPLEVWCAKPAQLTMEADMPEEMQALVNVNVITGKNQLDVGGGHKLDFILVPTPRWPDSVSTYDPASETLFTNKLFSAHIATEDAFDINGLSAYVADWRYYFECMLAPSAIQAASALDKLSLRVDNPLPHNKLRGIELAKADANLMINALLKLFGIEKAKPKQAVLEGKKGEGLLVRNLCPSHGPILQSDIADLLRLYSEWTQEQIDRLNAARIAVLYASAYGNTSALAQAISRGITKAGAGVETANCEMMTREEITALVSRCDGFVMGSPTLGGHMPTPIKEALGIVLGDSQARTKPCGVFGSFGWSGEAVDEMQGRLKDAGFKFAFDPIRVKFKPTEASLQLCEECGTDLAQMVLKSKKQSGSTATQANTNAREVEQAVGRLVGALCVVTAKQGDAESAMLASWVSQASFIPPGLTVAVAKDRAVESLMLDGCRFVLNVLGEAKYKEIMKPLLRTFGPGEDRFAGVNIQRSEKSGAAILSDSLSYLECTVTQRLDAGDHWVVYAKVDSGSLLDDTGITAVHHRKTGSSY